MAAIFPGIIAFLMYTKLQQVVGASIAGLTVYLMPIYGAFYGIFLFSEKLAAYHLYGATFVVIGIFLARKNINENVKIFYFFKSYILSFNLIIYVHLSKNIYVSSKR